MRNKEDNCPVSFKFDPYYGWTDVCLTTEKEQIFFILSNTLGSSINNLIYVLYFFSPIQEDNIEAGFIDYIQAVVNHEKKELIEKYEGEIIDPQYEICEIPVRGTFVWDEEGNESIWKFQREISPGNIFDFTVNLHIETHREEIKIYDFQFKYKDLCYAVSKACDKMLHEYGLFGYHQNCACDDLDINKFLYLKAIALNCVDFRKTTKHKTEDGQVSSYVNELNLLNLKTK